MGGGRPKNCLVTFPDLHVPYSPAYSVIHIFGGRRAILLIAAATFFLLVFQNDVMMLKLTEASVSQLMLVFCAYAFVF